jgi:Zn-finger nucleic acid-binding protein
MLEDASSTEVLHCLRCEGVWLRKRQLEQFLRVSATARGVVLDAVGMMESPPKPTTIKCPDCSGRYLEAVRYRGVEVERCPSCHGVYADADEREKIAERVLKARQGWESALREWEQLAASPRHAADQARTNRDKAGYLGMALASAILELK